MNSIPLMGTLRALRPRLLRILARKLDCDDAAQDVYQMVSEQLIAAQPSRPVSNPEAYLMRAAHNTANSYHRAATARRCYEAQAADESEPVEELGPERALQAEEALRVVEMALDELPLLTKRMFLAFRLDGRRQQDIARQYGVSLSTVEKRIATATLACHRRLRESVVPIGDVASHRERHKPTRRETGETDDRD